MTPNEPAAPPTRPVLSGRFANALPMVFMWLTLGLAAAAACGTIAISLPGASPFEGTRGLVAAGVFAVVLAALALILVSASFEKFPVRLVLRRNALLWRRLLRDVLGLIISPPRAAIAIGVGIVVGFLSWGAGQWLLSIPALAETIQPSDVRLDTVAGAPWWVPAAYYAIYAPLPEEILYRGPLLAICAIVAALTTNKRVRAVAVVAALLATSVVFGLVHLDWSLLNAVGAGVSGALYGIAALATRSLWPAIIAHSLSNALVFLIFL